MKKITMTMLLLALVLAGCNSKKKVEETTKIKGDSVQTPSKKYLSGQQLQEQIDLEIKDILSLANDERITDAIKIIGYTEEAIIHILDSNYTDATAKLEDAIGKATVMTAAKPELSLFPLDVQITTRDLVADIDVLKQIRKEAERLTEKGYLQAARHLLKDLASELEITTPMLPIATYPNALSLAAKALNDNNPDDALIILNTALSTVVIETKYVPLPLIRAERMIEEVSNLLEQKDNNTDINTLLENAEYQVRFAEALGYGKKDKEFEELYSAIKEIKHELKNRRDGDSVGMTKRLQKKISEFKDRLISNSKNDQN